MTAVQNMTAAHKRGAKPSPGGLAPPGPNHTTLRELARLPELTIPELKEQYRSLFGKPPPFHTQAFLVKRVAYRLQEIAHGGVSEAAHLKMNVLLQKHGMAEDGFKKQTGGRRLETGEKTKHLQNLHPGTVLRREWEGVMHEVRVEASGFVWRGQTFASLSKVAGAITGTNWNGPRFFGLRAGKQQAGNGKAVAR